VAPERVLLGRAGKQALLCVILRHYGQHDLTVLQTEIPQSAEAVLERGAALYYLGRYKDCRESLKAIESWTPTRIQQCQAAYLVSSACFYSGDTAEARSASQSHIALAEELHDIGELQTGLIHAGSLAYSLGDLEQARANYQRVLDYQHEYPSLQAAATAMWGVAVIEQVSGNETEAIEGYTAARELCRQIGSTQGVAWIDANLGELLLRAGQYSQAAKHLADAEASFAEQGVAAGLLHTLACRARLEYSMERRIPARHTLQRCVGLLKTHLDSPALTPVVALSYLVAFELDDRPFLEEVRAAVREALRKGADLARMGQAEDRWTLCRQVHDAELPDEQVYRACRVFIAGDQVEDA
jgi:tetratricopeptide (TPR) repeat protein